MLVEIAWTVIVVAFVAVALVGHVLVLTALMTTPGDAAQAPRESEAAPKASKLRFRLTSG